MEDQPTQSSDGMPTVDLSRSSMNVKIEMKLWTQKRIT
jgi:hypothetical protein